MPIDKNLVSFTGLEHELQEFMKKKIIFWIYVAEKLSLLKFFEKNFWKSEIFDLMCIPLNIFDNFSGIYGFDYTYKKQISEEQMNF